MRKREDEMRAWFSGTGCSTSDMRALGNVFKARYQRFNSNSLIIVNKYLLSATSGMFPADLVVN